MAASVEHLIVGASGGDGETSILEDVTVEVRDGERLALVGESGSGKSTICLALLGMLPHGLVVKRGRAVVRDREMLGAPSRHLRNVRGRLVGVVFQDPKSSLDPVRKVGWQIVEARRIHKLGDQKGRAKWADRTLQALGFSDPRRIGQSYPHQLSGGMRQRACIGAAVAAEPRLLLADEPTTALDMSVRGQVLRGLLSYCEENEATLVFVSHDIQVVRAVATRVVVMLGGRVLEEGPASLVLTRPRNPYTQGLLEATVTLDPRRRDEPLPTLSDETAQSQRGTGCPFAGRCGRARAKCAHTFPPAVESEDSNGEAMHHVWCWNPIP